MILVILGCPGSGKGTQSEILSNNLDIPHLNMGKEFRNEIEKGSEWGMIAKDYVNKGELVPDEFTNRFLKELLSDSKYKKGCIFDGFPRTIIQAEELDNVLFNQNKGIDCVVNLDLDYDTAKERLLKRGRKDDSEDIINDRIKVYEEETEPLIEHYKGKNLLKSVDCDGTEEEINKKIVECLSF
jgi:adenylate kinase